MWIVLFLLGLGIPGGYFLATGDAFKSAVPVRVAVVEATETGSPGASGGVSVLTANGYVVPRKKAAVSSEVGGRLAALYVEEGDTARSGQILGILRNHDQKARLLEAAADLQVKKAARSEALAALELARQEFERQTDLLARGLASQAAFDAARAGFRVAEARLESAVADTAVAGASLAAAEEAVEKTFIRAPFEGTVLRKEAEVGEIVTPLPASGGLTRGAIVTMADLKSCEMVVDVNESYVTRVREGQPAEVELDAYQGVRFPAAVRQVVPTADRQKATVEVKVAFRESDPRILPEMGGKVFFMDTGGVSPAGGPSGAGSLSVPAAAVRQIGGRSVVFVVRGGRARLRPVELVGPSGDRVRIGAGLARGEQVIVEGPESLKDGDRVRMEGE